MSAEDRENDGAAEAVAVLLAALNGEDEVLRQLAVNELGESELDDMLAGELLAIAAEEGDPELRAAAAIALGPTLEVCWWDEGEDGHLDDGDSFGAPLSDAAYRRVRDGLRRLYRDARAPKLVRRRALEASVRAPQEWHEGAVRAAWAATDPEWQVTAVFCMGCLTADFEAEIGAAFVSERSELRLEAVTAAGRREMVGLRPQIYALASSEQTERQLRLTAIAALGDLGSGDSEVRELLDALAESSDEELAEAASDALFELYADELAGDLDDDPDDDPEGWS